MMASLTNVIALSHGCKGEAVNRLDQHKKSTFDLNTSFDHVLSTEVLVDYLNIR